MIGQEVVDFYLQNGIRRFLIKAAAEHSIRNKNAGGEMAFEIALIELLGSGAETALEAIAKRHNIEYVQDLPNNMKQLKDWIKDTALQDEFEFVGEFAPLGIEADGRTLILAAAHRQAGNAGAEYLINKKKLVPRNTRIRVVLATRDLISRAYHLVFADGKDDLTRILEKLEKERNSPQPEDLAEAVVRIFARIAFVGASDGMLHLLPTVGLIKAKVSGVAGLVAETSPEIMVAILRVLISSFAQENESRLDSRPQEAIIDFGDRHMKENLSAAPELKRIYDLGQGLLGGAYRFRLQLARPHGSAGQEGSINVIFRVIRKEAAHLSLKNVGYGENAREYLLQAVSRYEGMVLFVGATGSGKTTSADALLGEVDSVSRWIFTIENPIEYFHPMFVQYEVRSVGDYLEVIKSLLRSNPDLVFFGECREETVAARLCELALTGSMVVSTLHAASAAGAVQRLRNWGIDDNTIADTLKVVVGQRLLPKLCAECRQPISDGVMRGLVDRAQALDDETIKKRVLRGGKEGGNWRMRGDGCAACNHSGVEKFWLAYEILPINRPVRQAISAGAPAHELNRFILDSARIGLGIASGIAQGHIDAVAHLSELEAVQ